MRVLNIVTSPRKDHSASRTEFDAETINAKYKGVSGEPMTPAEVAAWEKIGELASRFQSTDRIVITIVHSIRRGVSF